MQAVSLCTSSVADEPTWALYTLSVAPRHEQLEFPWIPEKLQRPLCGPSVCSSLPDASSFLNSTSHSVSLHSLYPILGDTSLLRTFKDACLSEVSCRRYHLSHTCVQQWLRSSCSRGEEQRQIRSPTGYTFQDLPPFFLHVPPRATTKTH
jgi:hypothetical protein